MTPDEYTNQELMLEVGNGHTLYVQDWGNKTAKTVIFFLHGGPGNGCRDKHKLAFDPKTQRVIFHDQRGSGKSLPKGRWHHNTTQDLSEDITRIADKLKIRKFAVTGNSWGSTLSLYYALNNPKRVAALVISGVFTASKWEIEWINQGRFATHFPDAWEKYVNTVPTAHRTNPTDYHLKRAFGHDATAAANSIRIFSDLESSVVSLNDRHVPTPALDYDSSSALIEMRYLAKGCFMPERFILKHAHKLTMPLYIVQGRYDFVCPPTTAYELSTLAPYAHLTWVTAGHSAEHETVTAMSLIYRMLTK